MTRDIGVGDAVLRVRITGEGPPVVLAHGLTFDDTVFDGLVPRLASRHQLVRLNLHGHGGSTAPDRVFTLGDMADDLVALLDALELPRVAWIGHSMGGMVGLRVAVRHPHRLTRLGLLNTSADPEPDAVRDLYHQVNEASRGKEPNAQTVAFLLGLMFSEAFRTAHPEQVEPYRQLLLHPPDGEGTYRAAHAVIHRDSIAESLPEIDLPLLVIVSESDASIPAIHGERIAHASGRATLVRLPGGHLSPVEQPDGVFEAVDAFLAGP